MVFSTSASRMNCRFVCWAPAGPDIDPAAHSQITRRMIRLSKDHSSSVKMFRAGAAGLATILALAGCGGPDRPVGTIGHVQGFGGLVAADEPRAALAGRDVLSAGGSAADAATAIYFTLAVTMPSTASLGGGGSCIVHDRETKKTEIIDFPAYPSAQSAGRSTAVPANPRGFYALHAKYGRFRFETLIAEPERLARSGVPVSRALAYDIVRAQPVLARDPAARALFLRPDGTPLREGDTLLQADLSTVLSTLRRNTGDFYQGLAARELVRSVGLAHGSLSLVDLRDQRPVWRAPISIPIDGDLALFAPPPSVGSTTTAALVAMLADRWGTADDDNERHHLLAESSARAFADRVGWMQPSGWPLTQPTAYGDPLRLGRLIDDYQPGRHVPIPGPAQAPTDSLASTGFVVLDPDGQAVVCGLSTQGLFGAGIVAPGTGIVLAGAPGPSGPPAITTMLTVNPNTHQMRFAGVASGGGTAPAALAQTFLAAREEGRPLAEAIGAPRLVHPGTPDVLFVETAPRGLDPAALTARGHSVKAVPMPSRVEAMICREGTGTPEQCEVATDPRGFGLATNAGRR
jgi:gamma-glutamyltranspeptidase/glutathione hydrolase